MSIDRERFLNAEDLKGIVDQKDPFTEYNIRYTGMLLNFINLPAFDMALLSSFSPRQRASCLATVDPRKQSSFFNEAAVGISVPLDVTSKYRRVLVAERRRFETAPDNPTSNNDMEHLFNILNAGLDYETVIKDKVLYAINLDSQMMRTLSAMAPPIRLAFLILDEEADHTVLAY